MSKEDNSYKYLIEKFGEDVIKKRYDYMEERALAFIKKSELENDVYLNHKILDAVILDYFADLERLKDFEGIEHANKNKITAFMSYWWLKRKPLQIRNNIDKEELVYINEKFISTLISKDFMAINSSKTMSNKQCEKCVQHIFYHLKYRAYTAQTLELMLMAADTGIEIGKLIG